MDKYGICTNGTRLYSNLTRMFRSLLIEYRMWSGCLLLYVASKNCTFTAEQYISEYFEMMNEHTHFASLKSYTLCREIEY